MTAPDSLSLHALAEDNLGSASPDLLRAMVKTFADALMSAEADALRNAGYGEVSENRVNHRNGYRPREWDTRAGTVELVIPRPRSGSYFPHWLLERRRRAEQVLISVVATAYLLSASTRRMEKLATSLGVTQGLSFESGLGRGVKRRLLKRPAPQAPAVEVSGLGDGPALGRAGGRVPQPAPGPRAYAFVWVDALTRQMRHDSSWQAQARAGLDIDGFQIDWNDHVVHRPRGKTSIHRSSWRTKIGEEAIHVEFSKSDCTRCPALPQCTCATREPRQLMLHQRGDPQGPAPRPLSPGGN